MVGTTRLPTLPSVDVAPGLDTLAHHKVVHEHGLDHAAHAHPFQVDLLKRASSWLGGPQHALSEGM